MGFPMKISVDATRKDDGSVVCVLKCDGQQAQVIFDGTDVSFKVPEAPQPESA